MPRRLFDHYKSPRNLPRKSTANESASLPYTGPAQPAISSNRALLRKTDVSDFANRPKAARMGSGTKNEERPWPGSTGLIFKRRIAFQLSPFSSAPPEEKGFGDMSGHIRLGLSCVIPPSTPLFLNFNQLPESHSSRFTFAEVNFSVSDIPQRKGVFDHGK